MGIVQHERNGDDARDDWETPPELFDCIDRLFNFDFDAAASDKNALCGVYITEEMDALKQDWSKFGKTAWCNPPYNLLQQFLICAKNAALHCGVTTVLLAPPRVDSVAFHMSGVQCSEIIFLRGRVQFLIDGQRPLNPKSGKPSGNGAASALYVFRPRFWFGDYGTPKMVFWDWKRELGNR